MVKIKNGAREKRPDIISKRNVIALLIWMAIAAALYLTSIYDYLLFHSIAEIFSIVIAFAIFTVAWNSRRITENNYLLFIGISYLFIGGIDFVHTLAYKGMGVFPGEDSNLATQLWIAARYFQSFSLLIAPVFIRRKINPWLVLTGWGIATTLLLATIFYWTNFPVSFSNTGGLTPFKIISEYIISFILVLTALVLFRNRSKFNPIVVRYIIASIIVTIASEMAFTLYTDVYGYLNMTGHMLKIIAFYLIYKALIETSLRRPYELLFRDLKQHEESLENQAWELTRLNEELVREVDIRRKVEDALRKSQEDLQHAQSVAIIGNWRLDIRDNTLTWSDEVYRIFGIPAGTGMNFEKFLGHVHPDDREYVHDEWNAALQGDTYDVEHRIITNNQERWVREIAEIEFNEQGKAISGFGTVQDITDLKKAEQVKDEFIGLVSHELRTPLTIIIGSLKSALSEGVSAKDTRELLENASEGAESLADILENMLELSRYQANRLQLELTQVAIPAITVSVLEKLKEHGITQKTTTDFPEGLPKVKADPIRVERILYNLLENAAKYSPAESEIKISCRIDGDNVITTISDKGEGIAAEDRNKLFELFQRLDNPTRTSGIGLGLVVCKRLVEAQGGWINVTSQRGEGSEFFFALPVYRE